MATALKEVYSESFYRIFLQTLKKVVPTIDDEEFLKQIFCQEWAQLELKERMSHTAQVLHTVLHEDYSKAVDQILKIIDHQIRDNSNGFNFEFMFFPDFIQQYGLDDYKTTIYAIENITKYTSCEFVVRHMINRYPKEMINQMQQWANHEHHYVRRLASEGMRTRLPWAISVLILKQQPELIMPILHKLINDQSEWVRKSVSNSLNDLSKDYPYITLEFTKKWINHSEEVNKALKHGARGLLKQGNSEMLANFGVNSSASVELKELKLQKSAVELGENIEFYATISHHEAETISIRVEYRIYFLRGNGTYHPKTFKISEKKLAQGEELIVQKKHSFKPISTRKYYVGRHYLTYVVNGIESDKMTFDLF